jgi:hypothetical protein
MVEEVCHAGRTSFFGGTWTEPCSNPPLHKIGRTSGDPIVLCDEHFQQVEAAGLVSDENIGKEDFTRRERLKKLPFGKRWIESKMRKKE